MARRNPPRVTKRRDRATREREPRVIELREAPKHVDKYAAQRPGEGDRQHYNGDGRPKRPLTQEAAERMVVVLREERGHHARAYHCPVCDAWHVGRRRRQLIEAS